MKPLSSLRAKGAFTLVELLAVIAIIGVLAAIIVPLVSTVRSATRNARCVSNLRELAIANRLYASDNKDRFADPYSPVTGLWWGQVLEPYLGKASGFGGPLVGSAWTDTLRSVTNCPSRVSGPEVSVASYGWNVAIYAPAWNLRFSAPPNPPRTIMVGDMAEENNSCIKPIQADAALASWATPASVSRHGSKGNFAFMDGSVRALSASELVSTTGSSLWRWW